MCRNIDLVQTFWKWSLNQYTDDFQWVPVFINAWTTKIKDKLNKVDGIYRQGNYITLLFTENFHFNFLKYFFFFKLWILDASRVYKDGYLRLFLLTCSTTTTD